MAHIPSEEEVEQARQHAIDEIEKKRVAQAEEGKTFDIPEDGHYAGVIPEDVWQGLKK